MEKYIKWKLISYHQRFYLYYELVDINLGIIHRLIKNGIIQRSKNTRYLLGLDFNSILPKETLDRYIKKSNEDDIKGKMSILATYFSRKYPPKQDIESYMLFGRVLDLDINKDIDDYVTLKEGKFLYSPTLDVAFYNLPKVVLYIWKNA